MMKKWKAKLATKLKSTAGESLAEVLIALLIAALALTMLASVIHTSSTMITQSKKTLGEYYEANQTLEKMNGSAAGTAAYSVSRSGASVYLLPEPATPASEDDTWLKIDYYTNTRVSKKTVAAYRLHR